MFKKFLKGILYSFYIAIPISIIMSTIVGIVIWQFDVMMYVNCFIGTVCGGLFGYLVILSIDIIIHYKKNTDVPV